MRFTNNDLLVKHVARSTRERFQGFRSKHWEILISVHRRVKIKFYEVTLVFSKFSDLTLRMLPVVMNQDVPCIFSLAAATSLLSLLRGGF